MGNSDQSLTIKVQAEVNKAKKQIEGLTKEVNDLSKATNDVAKSTKGIEALNKGFAKLGSTMKAIVSGFASAQVVVGAIDLAKVAAEAEQADEAFRKVLETMGADAEKEFQKIKDSAHGLIPDSALKQASAKALQLGVPLEKLAELMELARAKSREFGIDIEKAFDGLVGSVAGLSPAMAESLGITVDLDKAYNDFAKSIGITTDELTKQEKQIALTNEILSNSVDSIANFGDAELSAEENFKAFGVALENLKTEFGRTLLPMMNDLTKATTEWINSLDKKKLKDFEGLLKDVSDKLKTIWEFLGFINDIGMPDLFGTFGHKTTTGAIFGTLNDITEGIQSFNDIVDDMFYATGKLEEQGHVYESLAKQVKEFTGTSDDFDILKKAIVDTLEETNSMMNRWANSPNSKAYKDKIEPLQKIINELADAYTELETKKPFEPKIKTAQELADAVDDLGKATKEYTKEEINALRSLYKNKLSDMKRSNASLLSEKKRLNKEILKADRDLAKELKKIANDKFQYENDLYNKIREAKQLTMTPYQKQADDQKRIAEDLANAKNALAKDELEKYKTYRAEFLRLGEDRARKEIINGKEVERSKEEQQKRLLELYAEDSKMQEQYFDTLKQKAKDANELLKAQNKARIAGIEALITAQKASIKIMEKFVEALTGKKIKIDTSGIDEFVKKMHSAQADVDLLTNKKNAIQLDSTKVDEAKKKAENLKQLLTINGITAEIKANTTPAKFGIEKLITTVNKNQIEMKVNPKWEEAQRLIDEGRKKEESIPINIKAQVDKKEIDDLDKNTKIEVPIDTKPPSKQDVEKEIQSAIKDVDAEVDIKPNLDEYKQAKEEISQPTTSEHSIDVDNSRPERAIAENKKDTWSTHTIYVKEVIQKSGGGPIPQKFAGGGVFRGSGRVGGYDPFDSDSVNAYLTGGEYVINRRAVDMYGTALLDAINKMRFMKPKGYAFGGLVGNSTQTSVQQTPINLTIGSNSFSMFADRGVADSLKEYLNLEGGL